MSRVPLALLVVAGLLATVPPRRAHAHELMPAGLELVEEAPGRVAVLWKAPVEGDAPPVLVPVLPRAWRDLGVHVTERSDLAIVERWTVETGPGGLAEGTLRVDGLDRSPVSVVVRLQPLGRPPSLLRLTADAPSASLGHAPSGGFLRLGIEHILLGADHLLFVLALFWIVHGAWTLAKTVTAFTVAHSLTLAAATLGVAHAPLLPLNAAIAASILFLGPEVLRAERGQSSPTIRRPWLIAFAFGLLHGFGFASGLVDLGIPRGEVPLALLSFNVGVELGQLAVVVVALLLARAFQILQVRWPRPVALAPAYLVGGLGAFWTIQRTVALVAAGV